MRDYGNFAEFPVGTRVKIKSHWVDFYPFYGETGKVIRNSGRYLSIWVKFDEPRYFEGGHVQKDWGFNPKDLELIKKKKCSCDCHKK